MASVTRPTLIRGARQLLTLRGPKGPRRGPHLNQLGIIPDGAILIRNGVIEEVGASRRLENLAAARNALEIDASGRVVMPGFVDCHSHMMFPPPTNAGSEVMTHDRAVRTLIATTGQRLSRRGSSYLETMARHGTTTVEAKTGCGPQEAAETKVLRVLQTLNHQLLDVVPTFLFRLPVEGEEPLGTEAAITDWVCDGLLPMIRRRRLARFAEVEWDPDPGHAALFKKVLVAAHELGLQTKVHAEVALPGPAVAAAVLLEALSIDHLEHVSADEIELLARSPTIVTLLPAASFPRLHPAPARALIDAGAAVALGSNFNPSLSPLLNMQTVISLACLSMGMNVAEAISASTINAAYAVGAGEKVGSLVQGRLADLLFLNLNDYRDLPRQFGTNVVYRTMKRGEFIYKEGAVVEGAIRA